MFEHIVLLKFKPDVSIEVKESAVKRAHDFKGKIPGIADLSAGINVTEEIDMVLRWGSVSLLRINRLAGIIFSIPCIKVYCNPLAHLSKESSLWITRLLNVPL
ncbi:Dabb family protein [Paenibacillus thailandensis]